MGIRQWEEQGLVKKIEIGVLQVPYICIYIKTYLGVIVRLFYSLFFYLLATRQSFYPGLQTIRKDFLRPVCILLGTFLGFSGFFFVLVFSPVAQVSPHDNFRQLLEASSAPPTPLRYNLRNLTLQLHAPVNSDFYSSVC